MQNVLYVVKLCNYYFIIGSFFNLDSCIIRRWYIFTETCQSNASTIYMYLILCTWLIG